MRQHGKNMNIYSGKAFRLFAALLCMLFTAPVSHAQTAFAGEATLNAVAGPANEVIEAVNVTSQFIPQKAQPDNTRDGDDRELRGLAPSFDIHQQFVASLRAIAPENLATLPASSQQSANGTRAPPSLRKIFS